MVTFAIGRKLKIYLIMRQEVTNWFKQSEADLKSAKNSKNCGDYYMSVFASQQAAEKASVEKVVKWVKSRIKE